MVRGNKMHILNSYGATCTFNCLCEAQIEVDTTIKLVGKLAQSKN